MSWLSNLFSKLFPPKTSPAVVQNPAIQLSPPAGTIPLTGSPLVTIPLAEPSPAAVVTVVNAPAAIAPAVVASAPGNPAKDPAAIAWINSLGLTAQQGLATILKQWLADGKTVATFPYVATDFVDHQPAPAPLPYGGKGIYYDKEANAYRSSATGAIVPFDPAQWNLGQGSLNQGQPPIPADARAYAYWISPAMGAAFDAANSPSSLAQVGKVSS